MRSPPTRLKVAAAAIAECRCMTYMSIPAGLEPLVRAGRLFCLPSAIAGFDTARELYVSRSVMRAVSGPFSDDGSDDELIQFRQFLDSFLEGAVFTVGEDPRNKDPETMLARVEPVDAEIWDLRSTAPHPGIRCLGGFWEQNVFVALIWEYRENLRGRLKWQQEITTCQQEWKDLFGRREPLKGTTIDDYLTEFALV